MRHGNSTVLDLLPPGFAGLQLASYRTLLPLYNGEREAFSPWAACLPSDSGSHEQLRTMDLYELRQASAEAGRNMDGWDSCRGKVSEQFIAALQDAVREFVAGSAVWTLLRWPGYHYDLPAATPVTVNGIGYLAQKLDLAAALESIGAVGMPEFMWSSDRSFGWGAPRYPDFGVMTMAADHYIQHFAPSGFESFYLPAGTVLPDNLGD